MDHRDQHRLIDGKFKKRPGARGFRPLDPPKPDECEDKRQSNLALWVEKNKGAK
jgi:hypothetical protein